MILNVVRRRCRISDCQIYSAILHNECRCEIEVVFVDFDKSGGVGLSFPVGLVSAKIIQEDSMCHPVVNHIVARFQ